MTNPNAGNRRAERPGEATARKYSKPKYRLIEEDLRRRIGEALWLPGAMLPGRLALAREYDVDLTTLQRAVSALLEDGTLRADPGGVPLSGRPTKAPHPFEPIPAAASAWSPAPTWGLSRSTPSATNGSTFFCCQRSGRLLLKIAWPGS